MLSVANRPIMLSVIMLSVVMLNVIMLSVMAPVHEHYIYFQLMQLIKMETSIQKMIKNTQLK